jgi:hypothetical protein
MMKEEVHLVETLKTVTDLRVQLAVVEEEEVAEALEEVMIMNHLTEVAEVVTQEEADKEVPREVTILCPKETFLPLFNENPVI